MYSNSPSDTHDLDYTVEYSSYFKMVFLLQTVEKINRIFLFILLIFRDFIALIYY